MSPRPVTGGPLPAGTHRCPGGCGAAVHNRLFACRSCWAALPRDLQRPIVDTVGRSLLDPARLGAVQVARRFYRERAAARDPGTFTCGELAELIGVTHRFPEGSLVCHCGAIEITPADDDPGCER